MRSEAMVAGQPADGNISVPIVEQYAAIRARQQEIARAAGYVLPAMPAAAPPCSYGIWVRHGGRQWLVSWSPSPDSVMLTVDPAAAMRFSSEQAAAAIIKYIPALRDKAQHDEAGIVDVPRPYRGVPLFGARKECRLPELRGPDVRQRLA